MDWLNQENGTTLTEIPDPDAFGFVYIIKNLSNGMAYIGCKQFYSYSTPKIGPKKNKIIKPSNWRKYTGSNSQLNADIKAGAVIEKTVLKICYSKSELHYWELYYQMMHHVLLSSDYYNGWIDIKINKTALNPYDNAHHGIPAYSDIH
jgi:hypothetical protein